MPSNLKIGIIACIYGNSSYIDECLSPWINLRNKYNIVISIVHGQFKEYHDLGYEDNDRETQNKLLRGNYEDYLYIQNNYWMTPKDKYIYQTEAEIRNEGLQPLLKEKCDYVWLWDLDEETNINELTKTIEYIQKDEFICWYKTYYKNLVFDYNHYLDNFNPPRIFKVNYGDFKLNKCIYDNDFSYLNNKTGEEIDYKKLASKTVPRNIFFALHKSWCDYEASYKKIKYQEKRWNPPNGNGCGFKINHELKKIEFNEDYFRRTNQNIPQVLSV
jgi:hypothetical protein